MKIVYTEIALESLKEITDFLKHNWTERERKNLNDDIIKFINSLNENIITYPKYKKDKEIRFALVGKKQVKIFFEKKKMSVDIYLFWPTKKNPKLLNSILAKT